MEVSASKIIYLQLSVLVKTKPNCFLGPEILKTAFQWYFSRNLYNKPLLEQATLLLYSQKTVLALKRYSYKFTYNQLERLNFTKKETKILCSLLLKALIILSFHIDTALFFKIQLFLGTQ